MLTGDEVLLLGVWVAINYDEQFAVKFSWKLKRN